MSIKSEIARLQSVKNAIREALVQKGITAASTHNMADFADDIKPIPDSNTGTYTFQAGNPNNEVITGQADMGEGNLIRYVEAGAVYEQGMASAREGYIPIPTETIYITSNGDYDVTNYAYADVDIPNYKSDIFYPAIIALSTHLLDMGSANSYSRVRIIQEASWRVYGYSINSDDGIYIHPHDSTTIYVVVSDTTSPKRVTIIDPNNNEVIFEDTLRNGIKEVELPHIGTFHVYAAYSNAEITVYFQ